MINLRCSVVRKLQALTKHAMLVYYTERSTQHQGQKRHDSFFSPKFQCSWPHLTRCHERCYCSLVVLAFLQVSAATSSETRATGPSSSESKTGLASLPPLDPGVAPHRMTVSTVPARVTDEVFRLYVKYQVSHKDDFVCGQVTLYGCQSKLDAEIHMFGENGRAGSISRWVFVVSSILPFLGFLCVEKVSVHGDDPSEVTPGQFRRFLVDSPLIRETVSSTRRAPSSRSAVMLDGDSKVIRL